MQHFFPKRIHLKREIIIISSSSSSSSSSSKKKKNRKSSDEKTLFQKLKKSLKKSKPICI